MIISIPSIRNGAISFLGPDYLFLEKNTFALVQAHNYIPDKLDGFVELISHQQSNEPNTWTFLPDGISCLMFRLNTKSGWDILKARAIDQMENPSRNFCLITGFSTTPVVISYNHFDYIAVYLRPIALKAIFGIPAHELKDLAIEGSCIIPDLNIVENKLQELSNFYDKAQWLENWLYSKINESGDLHTALSLQRLEKKLASNQYRSDGKQLEDFMGYSRAQTHRIFNRWFGLSSQKYQRLQKFVRTLENVHFSNESFTSISHRHGYFDQAHFIRSFKEFAHLTPSQYRASQSDLVAQFPV